MEYEINDINELIFYKLINKNTNIINIQYILNFRLLNKSCNDIFKSYFKQVNIDISPRSTFINLNECFICYSIKNDLQQLIYNYDSLPHKCINHCDNLYCHISAIKRYLIDIKKNHIYPFCKVTNKFIMENSYILVNDNNNNTIIDFDIRTLKKYKNEWYVKIEHLMLSKHYNRLNSIQYLIDDNLFWWFLNRSNIVCTFTNNVNTIGGISCTKNNIV